MAGAMSPEPSPERRWWVAAAVVGLLAALPYAVLRHLPLVDLPLHQLAVAIRADSAAFSQYYENAPATLPYWLPTWLGALAAPAIGAEAGARLVVALYALALPLAGGLVARASGRSGWWGLLLAPFVLEFNLAYGFVAYCVGGLLVLLVVAAALRAEQGSAAAPVALASLAVGWTHPQMAVVAVGFCAGLQLLNRGAPARRRLAIVAASLPALLPSALWFADPERATEAFAANAPVFAGFGELLAGLGGFTVDVFPGPLEEALLGLAVVLVAASWWRRRPTLRDLRFAIAALGFLALYFVTPWDWNGQAVCQRLPFLALLCLPLLPSPAAPPGAVRLALAALAVVGVVNTGLVLYGFDRDTAPPIDALAAGTPEGARLAYVAYDVRSPWVHAPACMHAGAWITLRRGGVYAFHFNRLTSRYSAAVPAEQTLVGRELAFSRRLRDTGRPLVVPRARLAFWDTILVRWPEGMPPVLPVDVPREAVLSLEQVGQWGLLRLRPELATGI